MNEKKIIFEETFAYNLIYVFRINDDLHKGAVKVGLSTVKFNEDPKTIGENHQYLEHAARHRIDQYTKTAGVKYDLLHAELAITNENVAFKDYDVHKVLKNSGIKNKTFNNKANEWFITDLNTAKNAIHAVKSGRTSLFNSEVTQEMNPVKLRPNQKEAVDKTIKQFEKSNTMLWNAKMRFGKTLSALQIVKEKKFKKTIIITHRPIVNDGWYEDFNKIFYDTKSYKYGSKVKNIGDSLTNLESEKINYVYFASIQDLRGSSGVGGNFNKNDEIFSIRWDFVIVDEAHEGTNTELGQAVKEHIIKNNKKHETKVLELSGTPFNLLGKFDEDQIYTWDYVMEQREKMNWYINHYGDPNPYEDLPKMHIFTYDLDKLINGYIDVEDKAFNFREFFRVWTDNPSIDRRVMPKYAKIGEFVHKEDVKAFLDLLCKEDKISNYPYSTKEYRKYFRHSLWMVPGVKEAKALSKLMHEHAVFGSGAFEIVNVAGEGDDFEEKHYQDAKRMVEDAITNHPENTYTITLSCGRLTTGVSIKAWTAIFMLSGSASVSAQNYLQTIFRAQTPAIIGGKVKDSCYVFDFAPDRTLNMVAQASELSPKPGVIDPDGKTQMGEFLNFCPVIGIDGSSMEIYSVDIMMQQLKKAHAEQVVKNGFEDKNLYNDYLLRLDDLEIQEFNNLRDIIGTSKGQGKMSQIPINDQGMTNEDWDKVKEARNKNKNELTAEQKIALEKFKEAKSQQKKAIDILRGISIRIPMLIYGADIDFERDVTLDNFLDLVDDISWKEFMPTGVTKSKFKQFSKYYDVDVFVAAGRKIRNIAKSADKLNPTERVKKIAGLFLTFKNPDKETVLTPWRVVNMHLSDTLGGWCFYDNSFNEINGKLEEPRYVSQGATTCETLSTESSKILEINSKSGLYPLYVTYSIFKQRCLNCDTKKLDEEKEKELWKQTIKENIYVVCKTKMAETITKRTLNGYESALFNIISYENIIDVIQDHSDKFTMEIKCSKTWKKEGEQMKFNAVVGNPPYQLMDGGAQASAKPIYNLFVEQGKKINPDYLTMITPARWYAGGKGLDNYRKEMLSDRRIAKLVDFNDAKDCFSSVNIAGGISYFLWDRKYEGDCKVGNYQTNHKINFVQRPLNKYDIFVRSNLSLKIIDKVMSKTNAIMTDLVYSRNYFNLATTIKGSNIKTDDDVKVLTSKGYLYVKKKIISDRDNLLDKYKVIITYAMSGGNKPTSMGDYMVIPSTAQVLPPNVACSETYLCIGKFEDVSLSNNLLLYIKTKFFRFLLLQALTSIHITRDKFLFIPQQDFSKVWTDNILFEKYGLSNEEIEYIESIIKDM